MTRKLVNFLNPRYSVPSLLSGITYPYLCHASVTLTIFHAVHASVTSLIFLSFKGAESVRFLHGWNRHARRWFVFLRAATAGERNHDASHWSRKWYKWRWTDHHRLRLQGKRVQNRGVWGTETCYTGIDYGAVPKVTCRSVTRYMVS